MENPHAPNQVLIGASLDPEDWQTQDYVDTDTGKIFKLAIPGKDDDPRQPYPRTYLSALHQHAILKESKYPGGDGQGLLGRYHVHAQGNLPRLLGKEVERKQATGDNLAEMRIYEPPEYEIKPKQAHVTRKTLYPTAIDELKSKYSIRRLAKKTGLSRNTIAKAFQGELIQPSSWELLMKVYETTSTRKLVLLPDYNS